MLSTASDIVTVRNIALETRVKCFHLWPFATNHVTYVEGGNEFGPSIETPPAEVVADSKRYLFEFYVYGSAYRKSIL